MNANQVSQIMRDMSSGHIGGGIAEIRLKGGTVLTFTGKDYDEFMRFYDFFSWRWKVNPVDPESVSLEDYEKWKAEQ